MEATCQFAEEQGFTPSENIRLFVNLYSRYETIARHYSCPLQRLNLIPRSFIDLRLDELDLVPSNLSTACSKDVSVLTPKIAPLVAALVRLLSQIHRTDPMRLILLHDLVNVVSYNLYDMSYEGDYQILEEESDEEIEQQKRQAVQKFKTWEGWRDGEMWIADAIQTIVEGNGHYDYLPAISGEPTYEKYRGVKS